jgi:hypothetical protein
LLISDCSSTTSVVTDDFTDFGACSDPRAEIVRLWLVTDASGNQSTCTQRITIAAFNLAAVIFPADVTLNCATVNSTDPSVTGSPSINGSPIGTGWSLHGFDQQNGRSLRNLPGQLRNHPHLESTQHVLAAQRFQPA